MKENKSQFALLGLLADRAMSGYEIQKIINNSIGFFWQESFGQIYPNLKKMEEKGWAGSVQIEQEGRPDKKVFKITKSGREELAAWLKRPPEKFPLRLEILLKLFFGNHAKPEISIQHLESELSNEVKMLEVYKNIKKEIGKCSHESQNLYSLITLDYGIGLAEHNIAWCKKSIQKLKKELSK